MSELSNEMVKRLIELEVIVQKNGGYDYTEDFKDSVRKYLNKPLGRGAKLRLAKSIAKINTPIFKTLGLSIFKEKEMINTMNTVTLFFVNYMKKRRMDYILKDKEIRNIVYTMYCLDHEIPDIEV